MIDDWYGHWTEKNQTDRAYAGPFRLKPNTIMDTNDRQLVSSALQLRTGHGYFKSYLANIPPNNTDDRCNCPSRALQTTKHLLLHCRLYTEARKEITSGRTGEASRLNLHTLLHTKEGAPVLIKFLRKTKIATRKWALGLTNDDTADTASGGRGWGNVCGAREEHDTEHTQAE